jgi:K+-sensing histidine kinase KdpD
MMILKDDFMIAERGPWAVLICKGIVESHQGCIEAASDEDRGTTFAMDLPIAQLEA